MSSLSPEFAKWRQDDVGLHLEITMAQRLYTDRKWPDPYAIRVTGLEPGRSYEFRAIVRHPLLEMYGRETPFPPR